MATDVKPIVLVILDGFGMSPIAEGNAILAAKTPFFDWAIQAVPKTLLHASGAEVGLDWGEMGNSEVGHLNIGTGRIVMQDLPRINQAIENHTFFSTPSLIEAADHVRKTNGTLHIIGLASSGGVHAHLDHMLAMLDFAKEQKLTKVAFHLITDGRDTVPEAFSHDLAKITAAIQQTGVGMIATVSGRYYAMDRDKRWDRTQKAYDAMVEGHGRTAPSIEAALEAARSAKETDEFILPTVITTTSGKPVALIERHDVVICTNFRPDRARQLAAALTSHSFTDFSRQAPPVELFVSFTSYGQEASPNVRVAFFAPPMDDQLASTIAQAKCTQFHIAETEKYAHVTYFLNGGLEEPFHNEERLLIPSPKVATYDVQPAMSAEDVCDKAIKRLKKIPPAFTVINFANPDMVGHTGNLEATVRAIEVIDTQLIKLAEVTATIGATLLITADHGNAEQLIHPETHEIDKEHTTNPVPLFMIPPELTFKPVGATPDKPEMVIFAAQPVAGVLADIAPTILDLLQIEQPKVMTGQSLRGLM